MKEFFWAIFNIIYFNLFKNIVFKEYDKLWIKGDYKEAYRVYRGIVNKHSKWLRKGDPYVTLARLEFLANQDNAAALKLLQKAEELGCTRKSFYYVVLGQVYWRMRDIEKSIQSFQKAIELESSIYNLNAFGDMLSYEHNKLAVEIWERIIQKNPKNAIALAHLGIEAERAGNHEQAIKFLEKADNIASSNEDYFQIGTMYFRENQFQKALKYYHKCEKFGYKTHGLLFDEMLICYDILGDYNLSMIYSGKALEVHYDDKFATTTLLKYIEKHFNASLINDIVNKYPEKVLSYILLAWEGYHNNSFSKAEELLTKALELKPTLIERYSIARLFHYIEQYEKAISIYFQCEMLGYQYLDHLYNCIAVCYFALNDIESAIKYSIKSLELNLNDEITKDSLLYHSIQNETDVDFDKLLEKYPNSSFAYIINAHKAKKLLNISEANEYAGKALQANPSVIEKYYIAWLYMDLEDFTKALEIFKECEKQNLEGKSRLYQSFACCYYELQQYEKAIEFAEKVLDIEPDNEDAKEIIDECEDEKWKYGDNL